MSAPSSINRQEYAELLEALGFRLVDEMGWFKTYQYQENTDQRMVVEFDEWEYHFEDVLAQFEALGIPADDVKAAYRQIYEE